MAQSLKQVCDALVLSRSQKPAAQRRTRLRAIKQGLTAPLDEADLVKAFHDHLRFLCAYPDSKAVSDAAQRAVIKLCQAIDNAWSDAPARFRNTLLNTAIPGTATEGAFSIHTLDWLTSRFPRDVEVIWDDATAERLEAALDKLVLHVEADGLLDESLSTRAWAELAFDGESQWLWRFVCRWRAAAAPPSWIDAMFEQLDLRVRWRLRSKPASMRMMLFPQRPRFIHHAGIERSVDVMRTLNLPLPRWKHLPKREAERLIDIARCTLVARQRETDPVTYANPREVSLHLLERGVDVALFGLQPDRRLPIESYIGYVAAKNRQPIAYGGAWMFGERAEIGVNSSIRSAAANPPTSSLRSCASTDSAFV